MKSEQGMIRVRPFHKAICKQDKQEGKYGLIQTLSLIHISMCAFDSVREQVMTLLIVS